MTFDIKEYTISIQMLLYCGQKGVVKSGFGLTFAEKRGLHLKKILTTIAVYCVFGFVSMAINMCAIWLTFSDTPQNLLNLILVYVLLGLPVVLFFVILRLLLRKYRAQTDGWRWWHGVGYGILALVSTLFPYMLI